MGARVRGIWLWVFLAFTMAIVTVFLLAVANEHYMSNPVSITQGQASGFRIGMSKQEVWRRYHDLERDINLRACGTNFAKELIIDRNHAAAMPEAFLENDHWEGYRGKFGIWLQEYRFGDGKLTNIVTHRRLFERLDAASKPLRRWFFPWRRRGGLRRRRPRRRADAGRGGWLRRVRGSEA